MAKAKPTRARREGHIARPPDVQFPVVAIRASGGGLAAFIALLKALPSEPGMSFFLTHRLELKVKTATMTRLSKATTMPVIEGSNGVAVQCNCVYVIPPNQRATIHNGALRLETAEIVAQKDESMIRALLESTTQSILAVDSNAKIVLVNGTTQMMFGYSRAELVGQPLEILIPVNVRKRHKAHHATYFAHMESRPMGIGIELEARRKDSTTFPVEIGLSGMETNTGKLAVAFVSDITQRRQLEQAARIRELEIQALAASLLTAQEEERRRVSRELHDQICQQLASLAMDIGGLAAVPPPEDRERRLRDLQARVIKTSEMARHIAYQLHPSILDDLGLVASLRSLCRQVSEDAPDIDLKITAGPAHAPVSREVASCLYRVAQQSLQNILKHAKARHVSVALSLRKGSASLTIADDGIGFNIQEIQGRGGLGLISMQERARLVRGKLTITTKAGEGTRIAVKVPLSG